MAAIEMLVGLVLAQASPGVVTVEGAEPTPRPEWVDVGYAELASGHPEQAIAKIRANRAIEQGDPAALINLGSAHARLGRTDKAERLYKAAILSDTRYDLMLASGEWMDSRQAARLAIAALRDGKVLALR